MTTTRARCCARSGSPSGREADGEDGTDPKAAAQAEVQLARLQPV
jgi:hypothetical protein